MTDQKKILLLLPTGMTIRNFLSTDIVKEILESSNHKVICCLKDVNKYKNYVKHERIEYVEFIDKKRFSINWIIRFILRQRFYSINPNPTIKILERGPLFLDSKHYISSLLKYPFPRSKIIFNLMQLLEKIFFITDKNILKQIQSINPDLIFSTHLVANEEHDYLRIASKLNIQTVGMVKSFDNLTSKGFIAVKPNFIFLWSQMLKDELLELYDYDETRIKITGVPQFDLYKESPSITKKEFLEIYNLSENRKTILYATNHRDISPDDPENVALLAANLDKLNSQLIVRLHQMDNLNRYETLNFENVVFQVPGIKEGEGTQERVADNSFIKELRDVLYFSDVTINTCSTMTLDAISAGKPVINICYDLEEKPYYQSVKRFYDFVHYVPILNTKCTSLAHSPQELINLLKSNLDNKNWKTNQRKRVSQYMLDGNAGNASKKVAQFLNQIVEEMT